MHECLEKCKYFKRVQDRWNNTAFCTHESGKDTHGYRKIAFKKTSTKPPLWCPLRKLNNKRKKND